MKPIIQARGLSKRYRIGARRARYGSLRDSLAGLVRSPLAALRSLRRDHPTIWALKDVSFDVMPGEVVGIIGRNGAGKSTLLKILTRITEPTEGSADLYGRVASLLEVGTGFHPELTGRENIYLNGAILGMRRAEIARKFDEIVAFAEIDQFIDTAVKHYSSGMYVRLAFAVAAHLEPEILLVDEVLAVGDVGFQRKCLGKMGEVAKGGRTVLFVSHNMSAVENLCTRAILLKAGKLGASGETSQVVDDYLEGVRLLPRNEQLAIRVDRQGTGRARVVDFQVTDEHGKPQLVLRPGSSYCFNMVCQVPPEIGNLSNVVASIALTDHRDEVVWLVRSSFTSENISLTPPRTTVICRVHDFSLAEGLYHSMVFLGRDEREVLDLVANATELTVEGGDYFGTGSKGLPSLCRVLTRASWQSETCAS